MPPPSPAGVVLEKGLDQEARKLQVGVFELKAAQVKDTHDLLAARRQARHGLVKNVAAEPLAVFDWEVACGLCVF